MACIVLHYCQSAFEQFWKMRYTKVNLLLLLLLLVGFGSCLHQESLADLYI